MKLDLAKILKCLTQYIGKEDRVYAQISSTLSKKKFYPKKTLTTAAP